MVILVLIPQIYCFIAKKRIFCNAMSKFFFGDDLLKIWHFALVALPLQSQNQV